VFDELLMPDGERTVAGLGLCDELARPDEFPLLENLEISGSGGAPVVLFAAGSAPQKLVAGARPDTYIRVVFGAVAAA
jgi:hypothetical protein